jgi:hypothetical protein
MSRANSVTTIPAKGNPVPPPSQVPVPATWEEEELAAYEPKRSQAVDEKQRADACLELLARQLPLQWKALREIMCIRCESLNDKAGRSVLRAVSIDHDSLEVSREDNQKIEVRFDSATKKIKFIGKALSYDREYELAVQSYNGVDSTAWYSPTTLSTEQPDDLAKLMLSLLLRADQ